MQIKTLYKFIRADGGTTVSPNAPNGAYTIMFRIIADEGMAVTNDGQTLYSVIDTETIEGYYEVENPDLPKS